jgi:hypothetical protein
MDPARGVVFMHTWTVRMPSLSRSATRLGALALLLPVAAVSAQRVTGVVSAPNGAPIMGAVVSMMDSSGRSLTRTLADTSGKFGVAWQQNATRLRVVRIGFRPFEFLLTGTPRDTVIRAAMEAVAPMLATVRVRSDATCPDTPDRKAALALWEQARAALLAAVVAREAKPARMSNLIFERRLDPKSRRTRVVSARYATGSSRRPFLSARSAEALARDGYRLQQGSDEVYFAPDADVLLDEGFAATHCFGVQHGDDAHRGLVGLTFEPRSRGGRQAIVDVRGVLWLDPQRQAITRIEFRFTGVHEEAARAGAGGFLRFQSMENGVAFISEWSMFLPYLKPGQRPRDPPFVAEIGETGGLVLDAQWPDSKPWSAGIRPVRGRVTERSVSGAPLPGVIATIEGSADTVDTDSTGFFDFFRCRWAGTPLLSPTRRSVDIRDRAPRAATCRSPTALRKQCFCCRRGQSR